MAKMIHSMVRVMDEARSVAFYEKSFGLKVADRLDFPDFTLIYLSNPEAGFELELTVNKGRSEPYDQGNAYGHLAVVVDDLAAEHKRISAAGYNPGDIKHMSHEGKPLASFFFIQDPDGYKIEVLQKGGRFH
ncbi:MAG TPA: VOC family protein [Hyphomicrobium sp.]|nr:VOC family protein [Hyphomicrobium sp.]